MRCQQVSGRTNKPFTFCSFRSTSTARCVHCRGEYMYSVSHVSAVLQSVECSAYRQAVGVLGAVRAEAAVAFCRSVCVAACGKSMFLPSFHSSFDAKQNEPRKRHVLSQLATSINHQQCGRSVWQRDTVLSDETPPRPVLDDCTRDDTDAFGWTCIKIGARSDVAF